MPISDGAAARGQIYRSFTSTITVALAPDATTVRFSPAQLAAIRKPAQQATSADQILQAAALDFA